MPYGGIKYQASLIKTSNYTLRRYNELVLITYLVTSYLISLNPLT